MACGTCHDNVFFDTGTLNPPRAFGKPTAGACTTDAQCGVFGDFATCDVPSGMCFRKTHPIADRRRAVQRLPPRRRARPGAGVGGARGHLR